MGFIQRKGENFYWVISRRQSIKNGGEGKVMKVWYYLGDISKNYSNCGLKYLDYYLWEKIIDINEFKNKFVIFYLKEHKANPDKYSFSFDKNKGLKIKSKNRCIDFRKKTNREIISHLKWILSLIEIKNNNNIITNSLDNAIKEINFYKENISFLKELEIKKKEYEKCLHSDREITLKNIELAKKNKNDIALNDELAYLDELENEKIENENHYEINKQIARENLDIAWHNYLVYLDTLLEFCPNKNKNEYKEQFNKIIFSKNPIESLD